MGPRSNSLWVQLCPPPSPVAGHPLPALSPGPGLPPSRDPPVPVAGLGCLRIPGAPCSGHSNPSTCSAHAPSCPGSCPGPRAACRRTRGMGRTSPAQTVLFLQAAVGLSREGQSSAGLRYGPRAGCLPSTGPRSLSASGHLGGGVWRPPLSISSISSAEHLVAIRGREVRRGRQGASRCQLPRMT